MSRYDDDRKGRRARKNGRPRRRRSKGAGGPARPKPRPHWTTDERARARAALGPLGDAIYDFARPLLGRHPPGLREADLLYRLQIAARLWNVCIRAGGLPSPAVFDQLGPELARVIGTTDDDARQLAVRIASDRGRRWADDDRQVVVRKVRKTSTGVTLYFEEHDATCDAV